MSVDSVTWLAGEDVELLLAIADLGKVVVVNWGLLATDAWSEAENQLNNAVEELLPLIRTYTAHFPAPAGGAE